MIIFGISPHYFDLLVCLLTIMTIILGISPHYYDLLVCPVSYTHLIYLFCFVEYCRPNSCSDVGRHVVIKYINLYRYVCWRVLYVFFNQAPLWVRHVVTKRRWVSVVFYFKLICNWFNSITLQSSRHNIIINDWCCFLSVSYTHLDVYKRQVTVSETW